MTRSNVFDDLSPEQIVDLLRTTPEESVLRALIDGYVERRREFTLPLLIDLFRLVPVDYRRGDASFFAAVVMDIQETGVEGIRFLFDAYADADELRASAILMTLSDALPEDSSVSTILYAALNDDRPLVIAEAIGCLRHRGDTSVIDRVLGFADHVDPAVRGAAIDYVIAFSPLSAPPLIALAVKEMRDAAHMVCTAIESAATITPYMLLVRLRDALPRLYSAVTKMPEMVPRDDTNDELLGEDQHAAIRTLLSNRLGPNLDYWEVFDPFERSTSVGQPAEPCPEPVWWSLPYVLAEVYEGVKPGLQLLEREQPLSAIQAWRIWRNIDGAREILSALRAIHHLLADEHITP